MAKGFKFTQRSVEAAVCPVGKKDALVFDSETRGFGLRVTAKGSKTFLSQYQIATGKRRVVLGTFGVLTVEQGRNAAKVLLGKVADGADPLEDRRAKEATAKAAQSEAAYTFDKLITGWIEARSGERRQSYLRIAEAYLRRNLEEWRNRAAGGITMPEAVQMLDRIKRERGTTSANRTLAYASAAYGWAVKRQLLKLNPMRGIERPGRETPRERTLSVEELRAIWKACDGLSSSLAGFVRVLMLTLGRREEVASMRWAELDNHNEPTVWRLPRDRTKNGRAHLVPLPSPARAIIRALPKIDGNPFVFAGRGAKAVAAFSYVKDEIVRALISAGTPLPDWRFHDFRRSGVTALADMGFPPHVADRLLNHITGQIQGVALVYQRSEFLPERTKALDTWAAQLTAAAEQRKVSANIADVHRAR